ncbi:HDOD domain-containing protein [Vibrio sp.]|uniref:HDOD domain-containing protein n=1 Tax=Vibrio viridaestus TaxID=2487322 RepID=A0A3N9TCT3_9VIBR|nr:HDOD domain-containing protein [Vibrio viridaestus]MDC0611230.1 HDOD domain-containing protein [Vibrio sp.]RQW61493.1 HDOD domain-containing protein [Vibrio viridaestus]
MEYTYVARQPILNKKRITLGYELLFRDGEENAFPANISSDRATYRLIVENFMSIGQNPNLDYSRCFINFPYNSLIRRLPFSLPKQSIVVEVLETCPPTTELLDAIRELYRNGYLIALDDFVYDEGWERFIPYAHIIKIDVMDWGIEAACQFVEEQLEKGCKSRFLAEKVESEEEFQLAKKAGFAFFQGYFFKKPEVIKSKYIGPEQMTALALFKEVSRDEVDFAQIESIIAQDVTLSYKLLHFVNSMSNRPHVTISSFKQALIYLGEDRLKMFVALTVASYVSVNKPKELYYVAIQRAKFCQLLIKNHRKMNDYRDKAFLIGLFSVLDALLDSPMSQVIEQLPLEEEIKQALETHAGKLGKILEIQERFENADWKQIELLCKELALSTEEVTHFLYDAQCWSKNSSALV